jgi:hypothetical protein
MPKGKILMGKTPKPVPGKPKPGIPKPKPVQPRANKKNETVNVFSKYAPMSKKPGKTKPVMPRRGGE